MIIEYKSKPKVAVLIPCYNEALTIGKVIKDFQKELPTAEIYVCDNNSSDNTAEIAERNGATVLTEHRQGKGFAVLHMFQNVEADIYIMIDGDDTYPAHHAPQLMDALIRDQLDMVVGDRLSNGTYKKENKRAFHDFGNHLIKRLINNFFGSKMKDILSGYRVFSSRFIKNYATLAQGFELETDLSIFSLHYNLKIKELPIDYRDRPEGSVSKLNTVKDGVRVILTFFNLYRNYKPLSFFTHVSAIVFLIALFLGSFPIYEYITHSYVYKVPTAILAGFMSISALLLFLCGLILDTISKIDKKSTELKIRNFYRNQNDQRSNNSSAKNEVA